MNGLVVVATAGQLVAYDRNNGQQRWLGPEGGTAYSSPHLFTIDGTTQIVMMNKAGTMSVAPANGKLLWQYALPEGVHIVQPAITQNGDLLISEEQRGIRRISAANKTGAWKVQERWTSMGLKPYFNDYVVHNGHAYGFDGSYLTCIDLQNGERKWKGGHYGHGQLILLADQDLLLVLTEQGELALVKASSDSFTELARFPAIQGKTWNHPVLSGNLLLVRNGEQMAAFQLSPEL